MTAKEYLKQYEEAERLVRLLRIEYEKELDLIDAIKSPLGGDGTPHSGGISKTVENRAIRLADKADQVKEAELEALRIRQEIYNAVCSVPGEAGSVLYERYINLKSWGEVAKAVGYSKRQAHNLERQGLDQLQHFIELHSE